MRYCVRCGKQLNDGDTFCSGCGTKVGSTRKPEAGPSHEQRGGSSGPTGGQYPAPGDQELRSKMAAGLFGIFLGAFGVHNFYLGYTGKGIAQACLTGIGLLLSCCTGGISFIMVAAAGIWGLIEGILILCGQIYTDGKGAPLRD